MKRLKIFILMTVLSIVLCGCGGKEAELSGDSANGNNSAVEQNAGDDKKDTIATEDKKNKDSKSYECLPEVLQAGPEQRLMQIGDMVFRLDNSMSFADAMDVLLSSGGECTFYDMDGYLAVATKEGVPEEISMDEPLSMNERVEIYVLIDGESALKFYAYNTGDAFTKLTDDAVKVTGVFKIGEVFDYCYYFKGIRSDGEGLTYDSIKELMTDYADNMYEGEIGDSYEIKYSYYWTDANGKVNESDLTFRIDRSDKNCIFVEDSWTYY